VIDGNVMRVLSRWFAMQDAVDSAGGKAEIEKALKNLIDKKEPGKFNQAMMEFGATWCKPNNPDCENCIFSSKCLAFKQNRVSELPRKLSKLKIRNRYFYYLVLKLQRGTKQYTFLKKRSGNDIWKGLYEFPLIELPAEESIEKILESPDLNSIINNQEFIIKNISQPFNHQLTHQKITAKFLVLEINAENFTTIEGYQKIHASEIEEFPVSRLISKFLETNLF
jgi:A/G-specific adenine glycosylase